MSNANIKQYTEKKV